MKNKIIIILATLAIATGAFVVTSSSRFHSWLDDLHKEKLPPAENVNVTVNTNTSNTNTTVANANTGVVNTNTTVSIPEAKNLAVPFTSQAPEANWDQDHEEFCEEASMAMVGRFYQGRKFDSKADAEAALQQIKKWEVDHLGFYYDTTAAETAQAVTGMYGLKVELKTSPTIHDIQLALTQNKLVIVPAAGQELGNPNFTAPGPIYHNFVIRGYTKDGKFITNDPGTRKGEAYVYDESVVMNAIHDWVPDGPRTTPRNGDVVEGKKVVLIVSPAGS